MYLCASTNAALTRQKRDSVKESINSQGHRRQQWVRMSTAFGSPGSRGWVPAWLAQPGAGPWAIGRGYEKHTESQRDPRWGAQSAPRNLYWKQKPRCAQGHNVAKWQEQNTNLTKRWIESPLSNSTESECASLLRKVHAFQLHLFGYGNLLYPSNLKIRMAYGPYPTRLIELFLKFNTNTMCHKSRESESRVVASCCQVSPKWQRHPSFRGGRSRGK